MISLEINGIAVPVTLPEISLQLKGQIFELDALAGGRSWPFEIPITKESQEALGYPELLANPDSLDRFIPNCRLYFRGSPLFTGTVQFLSARRHYRVTFNFGIGGLKLLGQKKLNEFVLGGQITGFPNVRISDHADNVLADPDSYPYLFPCIFNESIYQGLPLENNNQLYGVASINSHTPATGYELAAGGTTNTPYLNWVTSWSPQVRAAYLVTEVFKESDIRFSSNFLKGIEIKDLLVYNSMVADIADPAWDPNNPDKLNPTSIWLNRHVPDLSFGSYIRKLCRHFCLFFNYNFADSSLSLESFKEVHTWKEEFDITDRLIGPIMVETLEGGDKNFKYQEESNDLNTIPEELRELVSHVDNETVDLESSLIKMTTMADPFSNYARTFLVPNPNQDGNSYDVPPDDPLRAPFGLRLLFYRGMQPDSNGDTYPMASVRDKRYDGSDIPGVKYTLDLDGEKGLKNVWWKDYIDMLSSSKFAKVVVKLTLEELLSLDLRRKVRVRNSLFYIKLIKFKLGRDIGPVEIEMYRI